MSSVQFESASTKEKARQELREAREEMLKQAKAQAEQRAKAKERERLNEGNYLELPSSKESKSRSGSKNKKKKEKKERERKEKKSKKSKKKSKKKKERQHSSVSSETSDESENEGSSDEGRIHKKAKKSEGKAGNEGQEASNEGGAQGPLQRESWMTDTLMLKTFSHERREHTANNNKNNFVAYDPAKSSRELNPYWKATGTGLPGFQKPREDSDSDDARPAQEYQSNRSHMGSSSQKWKKKEETETLDASNQTQNSTRSLTQIDEVSHQPSSEGTAPTSFLTDQQMNELGAKVLKAEILGNMSLANELREKLEKARIQRITVKSNNKTEDEKDILLTHTDARGQSWPMAQTKSPNPNPREANDRKKRRRMETHVDGERVRYFADDDRYDIKQMFEREKCSSAAEADLQFAKIAAKHKNPNDDLDDIFTDKARRSISDKDADRKELHRAIGEHKRLEAILENCEKCFGSQKLRKELLVAMGERVYLSLPWHVGLQSGHCVIRPNQHVSCSTQLDEETWSEVGHFRKALTRMFAEQKRDVIFFEIANRLHRRPHLSIQCVPIPAEQAEVAPFYFKKAIEESEHEWSVNKQLISLRNKDLLNCIPKGLPYFWVNFGMDSGFAHVIEDQDRFPANFAQEIIGGMLHMDANNWRRPQKEQNIAAKVKAFADRWKKYDFTQNND